VDGGMDQSMATFHYFLCRAPEINQFSNHSLHRQLHFNFEWN
jgi:hypothetical protein